MDFKDLLGVMTFGVSCFAAYTAFEAKQAAQRLETTKFESSTTIELLSAVFDQMTIDSDPTRDATSCIFVEVLSRAEKSARQNEPPYYVEDFVQQIDEAGLWSSSCQTRLEALQPVSPASSALEPEAAAIIEANDDHSLSEIGTWHALVASYDVTSKGCQYASEDVPEFARLLAGDELEGLPIYVIKTTISNNYAVTVDAGDDRALASKISQKIRGVSDLSFGNTGRDSFVQGNRNWIIDPQCAAFAEIGS
ncbi:MAG: hypothetical protein ABJF50_17230 [Paracoccaceae bacterium]